MRFMFAFLLFVAGAIDSDASSRRRAVQSDYQPAKASEKFFRDSKSKPNVDLDAPDDSADNARGVDLDEDGDSSTGNLHKWYWQEIQKNQQYCRTAIAFVNDLAAYLPKNGSNSQQDAKEIIIDFEKYTARMSHQAVANFLQYMNDKLKLQLKANESSDITLNNCRSAPVSFLSMVLTSAPRKTITRLIKQHEIDKFLDMAVSQLNMRGFPAMQMLDNSIKAVNADQEYRFVPGAAMRQSREESSRAGRRKTVSTEKPSEMEFKENRRTKKRRFKVFDRLKNRFSRKQNR